MPKSRNEETVTQSEILKKYGMSKNMMDRYLPKPIVKQGRRRGGGWYYSRCWLVSDVEQAVKKPEVRALIERRDSEIRGQRQLEEARTLLISYNPEAMVQKAKDLKRCFVLHVGPTNSGKTYDAVKALQESGCGTYLGPLRLLALEMFDKLNAADVKCSLVTGEEQILTDDAQVVSSTVELCDYHRHFKVAVIDEAQLITDSDRGSAWFKAICSVDAEQVHICLAPEALGIIEKLVQEFGDPYNVVMHERLVPLQYSGRCRGFKDIHPGDAIICFSRASVLSTAALMERNGFKASVIYGALPPVARRNEVARYLAGDTNIIVATDAIGMGISLPIRRVVFAETQKFDGKERRPLLPSEVRQIAGRAGRYGMFDLGEVLTMDSTDTVSKGLNNQPRSVRRLCLAFPKEVLSTEYPLDILLKAWQSLPDGRTFHREDVKDALTLYYMLGGMVNGKDRELVYDLITCPVDSQSRDLLYYWADCARAILRGRRIPFPPFGTDTLQECELQYKAFDIRHQLMMRIGKPDSTEAERNAICQRIAELMQQDKSGFIKKCTCCGRELPLGYAFNICEKCHSSGNG